MIFPKLLRGLFDAYHYLATYHRNLGIGSLLVQKAMKQAQNFGITHLFLFTSNHVAWYASMGWELIEELSYLGENLTVMKKDMNFIKN